MTIDNVRYAVITVMGPHAGEDEAAIFARKKIDTEQCGKTFWLVRSSAATPQLIQRLVREAGASDFHCRCIFVSPASPGTAQPTSCSAAAVAAAASDSGWPRGAPNSPGDAPLASSTCKLELLP